MSGRIRAPCDKHGRPGTDPLTPLACAYGCATAAEIIASWPSESGDHVLAVEIVHAGEAVQLSARGATAALAEAEAAERARDWLASRFHPTNLTPLRGG